jgi:hypothetical protein
MLISFPACPPQEEKQTTINPVWGTVALIAAQAVIAYLAGVRPGAGGGGRGGGRGRQW